MFFVNSVLKQKLSLPDESFSIVSEMISVHTTTPGKHIFHAWNSFNTNFPQVLFTCVQKARRHTNSFNFKKYPCMYGKAVTHMVMSVVFLVSVSCGRFQAISGELTPAII